MLLAHMLGRLVTIGRLSVIDAVGGSHVFAGRTGPAITFRLHDPSLHWKLALNPRLFLGEAYMDGTLTVEEGSLYDFLDLVTWNIAEAPRSRLSALWEGIPGPLRRFQQWNPVDRSRQNVAHHYDLSDALYELFLDRDRQYSCAYFSRPGMDLDAAQLEKKRHVAAKLMIEPGMKVLDIGSGWGGLALYLAGATGAQVTGLTLSVGQLKIAETRAASAGLADRVRFHLRDYRDETGTFDRIVSVGMFEHVGLPQYPVFFGKMKSLLAPDGVALLHAIGRMDGPGATNPWIRKYIFPGGYSPALSEVLPVIEKTGLWATDIEVLRLHYAETLRHWRQRFLANVDRARALYDDRFCRMWEFYLAGSEAAFRRAGHMAFQIQLARRLEAVPLTREYIYDWDRPEIAPQAGRAA